MTGVDDDMIAITGCGWITPAAAGSIEVVLAACATAPTPAPANARYRPIPDEVLDGLALPSKECRNDGAARLAAAAFELAQTDAGLSSEAIAPERLGMVLGCSLSGQMGMIAFAEDVREQSARFVSPIRFPQTVGNYVSGALARAFAIGGPNLTIACGAASGTEAILEGRALLTRGEADVVVAGASERLTDALARELHEERLLQRATTAVDSPAEPTSISEGACMFVLERWADASRRGARALAFLPVPPKNAATRDDAAEVQSIVSTAGFVQSGAIFVERMTGNCLGVLGAAAVAGAIGAAGGHPVPWIDEKDQGIDEKNQIVIRTIDAPAIALLDKRGDAKARAVAINDGGEQSVVELLLSQ